MAGKLPSRWPMSTLGNVVSSSSANIAEPPMAGSPAVSLTHGKPAVQGGWARSPHCTAPCRAPNSHQTGQTGPDQTHTCTRICTTLHHSERLLLLLLLLPRCCCCCYGCCYLPLPMPKFPALGRSVKQHNFLTKRASSFQRRQTDKLTRHAFSNNLKLPPQPP